MTQEQAKLIVSLLTAAYSSSKALDKPETLALYEHEMRDLDYETASAAIRVVIRSLKFWPSLAEIDRAYREEAADRRRTLDRAREQAEIEELQREIPDEERVRLLEAARNFMAERWSI